VALAAGFVAVAPRLVPLGLSGPLFYVVLVPLGLAAAAFLKQALSASSADVQATFWFGTVKVGGPVAVAALVVGGGMYLLSRSAPTPGAVALVVRVPAALRDVDLTRATDLVILSGQRRIAPETVIPSEARFTLDAGAQGHPLRLTGNVPGYDLEDAPFDYPADGVRWLAVQPLRTVMTGRVVGPDGAALDGATVVFDGSIEVEAAGGAFRAVLPRPPGDVQVEVRYRGRVGYRRKLTTPGDVTLRWSPP
jgi:hypothetical protein